MTVRPDETTNKNINPGNDTEDRVFLLSFKEAEELFGSRWQNKDRQCQGTEYCCAQGAVKDRVFDACYWWLRSPSTMPTYSPHYVAFVDNQGYICDTGYRANVASYAVRPALWIEIG